MAKADEGDRQNNSGMSAQNYGLCTDWMSTAPLRCSVFLLFLMLTVTRLFAQKDSLVMKNGNVIVGEIKSLDKAIVAVSTGYSKNDFTIKWDGVKQIYSTTTFLITLKDGSRINGTIQSEDSGKVILADNTGKLVETTMENIVNLKGLKSSFWGRVHANVDLGLDITKANSLKQYSVRSSVGYMADMWNLDVTYNDIRSSQDNVATTKRTESGAYFSYVLPKDWYLAASIATLSNTEQSLDLRFTAKAGAGKYIVHTNKAYFSVGAGGSHLTESFTNGTAERSSFEGYVATNANLFNTGDFRLLSSVYVYAGITEAGRWRTDFDLDGRYNLPLNLYIGMGVTLNYDNKPAESGKEIDYVYVFSVGWKL
jgi:hypothetical protein